MADIVPVPALLLILKTYTGIQNRCLQLLRACHEWRLRRRRLILLLRARRRSHVVWAHPRSQHWWDTIVPDFSSMQFMQNFRVSRESFEYICRRVKHVMGRRNTNYRLCVPIQKRVAIAIWKLATGSDYKAISNLFGVGLSTVCNCVQDFCNAAIKVLLPVHIKFPDADKLVEMATSFHDQWGVPQCVGAIDASHIPIIAPRKYPRDYRNGKGWHSIVLQAVVDAKGLFWDICVGFPGSEQNARVLQQSHLWSYAIEQQFLNQNKVTISDCEVGHYLIGDSAYLMRNWLMKPFSDTDRLTPEQRSYNHKLSSARSIVETSFGRLKGRWRCLLKRNACKVELSKKMVLTCCVLHNICEEYGDDFTEEHPDRYENIEPPVQAILVDNDLEGADIRAALIDFFNKGE